MSVLSPRRVLSWHLAVIAMLVAGHLIVVCFDGLGHHQLLGMARLFRLGGEYNFPALFSSLALIMTSLAAFAVARRLPAGNGERRPWQWLGYLLAFMAVDEAVALHEQLEFVLRYGDLKDRVLAPGVVPYVLLAGFLAYKYWSWWLGQTSAIRALIFCAGAVYIAGAAGIEHIEVVYKQAGYAADTVARGLLFSVEEGFEMLGVALLLNAFLRRLAELGGGTVGFEIAKATLESPIAGRSVSGRSAPVHFGEGRTVQTVR